MSFWVRLREAFSGGDDNVTADWTIIDVAGLVPNGGRASPRDRVALLHKLAQFAEREELRVCVLLEGRPLREAPDGDTFKSMPVYYAESAEQLCERAKQLVRDHRSAILVTHRRELEEWAQQNRVPTLRTSSLRRGLDEQGGNRGGDGGRSRGGRGRKPASRQRRNSGEGRSRQKGTDPQPKPQSPPEKSPPKDGVSDLIDLV